MKLEYLDDITDGGKHLWGDPDKLIRLYDFNAIELVNLKEEIKRNLVEADGDLIISSLPFVLPLNCTLIFRVSSHDLGVKFPPVHENNFVGNFSKHTYDEMMLVIDSLIDDGAVHGFTWLYDPATEEQIDLLLSSGVGSW